MDRCQVHRADGTLALTHREVAVLRYFLQNSGRAIERGELLREVWDYASGVRSRATDNAMARLRNKVEAQAESPVNILSVRGVGYRFEWSVQDAPEAEAASPEPRDKAHHSSKDSEPELRVGQDALDRVRTQLSDPTVLHLFGPPGVGKSHLAALVARGWRTHSWLVDMEGVRDAEGVAEALAHAMGMHRTGPVVSEHIGRSLQGQSRPLIVLDNAGGLTEEALQVVRGWRDQAPQSSVLITARQAPRDPSWNRLALGPLSAPDARRLFLQCAQRAVPTFDVAAGEEDTLSAILVRLDHLPLSIELAASRIRLVPLGELLRRLEAPRGLAAQPVNPSLQDAFLWIWNDLAEEDQRSLDLLCTFEGAFSLADAEAMLDPETDAMTSVARLLDAAMVLPVEDLRDTRFRLLNTVRELLGSRRAESVAQVAVRRHLDWCVVQAGHCVEAMERTGQADPHRTLSDRLPDFLQALCGSDEPEKRAALLLHLLHAQALCSSPRLCIEHISALLSSGLEADLRSELLLARAEVYAVIRESSLALRDLEEAYANLGDSVSARGRAARTAALVHEHQGNGAAAFDLLEQALTVCSEAGEYRNAAHCQMELSRLGFQQSNPEWAETGFLEALRLARRAGDRRLEGQILGYLGITAQCRRSYAEAHRYFQRSLAGARRVEDLRGVIIQTINLGNVLTYIDVSDPETESIESDLRDNLELAVQMGRLDYQCASVSTLMDVLIRQDRAAEACELVERLPPDWSQVQPTVSSLLWTNIAAARHLAGEFALAERAYVSAAEAFERSGQSSHVWRLRVFRALYLAEIEHWEEALVELDEATEIAEPPPCVTWLADVRTAVLACRIVCETTRSPDQAGSDSLMQDAREAIGVVEVAKPLKRLPIPIESTRAWVVRLLHRALP